MFKRYGCTIAVALLAVGAGAGCGGDDEESLSKAEYIKQGDAICKKARAEADKDVEEMLGDLGANEEPSEEQLKTIVEDVVKPNTEGQLEELRDLPAPEGDEETLNGIYDGVEEGLEKIGDDPIITEKASQEAEDYGFECFN